MSRGVSSSQLTQHISAVLLRWSQSGEQAIRNVLDVSQYRQEMG